MTIGEIYEAVLAELNKDQTGEYVGPEMFTLLLKRANIDLFKVRYGAPETYRPGMPMPAMGWEMTQKITDDLSMLKVSLDGSDRAPLVLDDHGYADLPSDYLHQSSAKLRNGGDIEFLSDDEFTSRQGASLKGPSYRNPIARISGRKIQVLPVTKDRMVYFHYIKAPANPFFDYKVVDDAYVYLAPGERHDGSVLEQGSPSRSVEIDWPAQVHGDIINLVVSYVSSRHRSPFMRDITERRKIQGQ